LDVLNEDIMNVFHDFHARGKFGRSFNATFIALIPMKSGQLILTIFLPVSLVGRVYKIVVKVLANMLKMVLEKILS
jgi:hypothetical protein